MKRTLAVATVLLISLSRTHAASGPERLKTPRHLGPYSTFSPVPSDSSVYSGDRSAALSVGKPGKILMLDAWITSDYMPDDWTTAIVWYDIENLAVVGSFFAQSSAEVTASVNVVSDRGTPVAAQSFSASPFPAHSNRTSFTLGALPVGYYRVRFRVKQGSRTIGQEFWIQVEPTPQ